MTAATSTSSWRGRPSKSPIRQRAQRLAPIWAAGGLPARPDDAGEALAGEYSARRPDHRRGRSTADGAQRDGGRAHRVGWRDALAFLRERHA
jgi:hypothetical protein